MRSKSKEERRLSQTAENILYIGHNVQLAQTMLDFSSSTSAQVNYKLDHFSSADDLEIILEEKEYSHLICDAALSQDRIDKITADFPLLKTTYLCSIKVEEMVWLCECLRQLGF
jgi:hypothetical protein